MIALLSPGAALHRQLAALTPGMLRVSILDLPRFVDDVPPAGLNPHRLPEDGRLTLPIPVPLLPGMDAVEVDGASLAIAGWPKERDVDAKATGGTATMSLVDDPTAVLKRVTLRNFRLTATGAGLQGGAATGFVVKAADGDGLVAGTPSGEAPHLHLLVQGRDGPPLAAVPHFAMPGAASRDYGPALGGASLSATVLREGATDLTLTLAPPPAGGSFTVKFAHTADKNQGVSPHGGLPNDTTGWVHWSVTSATATFATLPRDMEVTLAGPGAPEPAVVASFPGAAPTTRTDVDLAPAMRAIARAALTAAQGDELGLTLEVKAAGPGEVRIALPAPRLRYVRRPLPEPAVLKLRGARGTLKLPVPPELTPDGLSLAIDGRYGLARLLDAIGPPPPAPRMGRRLVPGRRVATAIALSAAERLLPLRRIGVLGRAEGPADLLLAVHDGEGETPGARRGDPVALSATATTEMAWRDAEWAAPALAPPHPERLFIVAEVTHGAFLLAADPAGAGQELLSSDGGAWIFGGPTPQAALWVDEADPATGMPAPLHPLDLDGPGGVLNRDVARVAEGAKPPGFGLSWVAIAPEHAALLAAVGQAEGELELGFYSRRDVDLTLSDAVLTYDPWGARG